MNQPEQYEVRMRNVRRPGKPPYLYAEPKGSRCACDSCTTALRLRQGVWGAIEEELRV
jgi:hypothetical protein